MCINNPGAEAYCTLQGEVTVEIRKAPESDVMNIIFYGEKYALIVKGAYRGKNNAEFNYRFFTK